MQILLSGYGSMGQQIEKIINQTDDLVLSDIISLDKGTTFAEVTKSPDVIIDFSHPAVLEDLLEYAVANRVPVVLATTGYTAEQLTKIEATATKIPVLYSANYSLGVILMNRLVKEMTTVLKDDFDIEVIEKHHNKKIDAPSGTAKLLVDSINEQLNYKEVHGRSGYSPRSKEEIGIHAVRGGTIAGEHEVIYAGDDEVLSIKHEAHSKVIFAKGAVRGATWLAKQPIGYYSMNDVLFGGEN